MVGTVARSAPVSAECVSDDATVESEQARAELRLVDEIQFGARSGRVSSSGHVWKNNMVSSRSVPLVI